MKISILGSGAYGLALSLMFDLNKANICIWTKFQEEKDLLEKERMYKKVLPDIKIPNEIKFTCNMEECKNSDLIVIAVPAEFVDSTCQELKNYVVDEPILIAAKGIDNDNLCFLHETVQKYIKNSEIAILSGPTFAIDLASKVPSALTLACKNINVRSKIKNLLENEYLKIEESDDVIGTEVCGSYKNIVAIAAGILDGLNVTITTKAMFLTEAFKEMNELILALSNNNKTIISFAGYGDFLLTCTSDKSRNFTLGKMIGRKKNKEVIDNYIKNTTIEGLYTLKPMLEIVNNNNIKLLLLDTLKEIIDLNAEPEKLLYLYHKKHN